MLAEKSNVLKIIKIVLEAEIIHLHGRYYSAQVCAQVQVQYLFLDSHNPMGRQSYTTGERSGAGSIT